MSLFSHFNDQFQRIPRYRIRGEVVSVLGMILEVRGISNALAIGSRCRIFPHQGKEILSEVVGFKADNALLMSFTTLEGIGLGCAVEIEGTSPVIYPTLGWLGRVLNGLGQAIDAGGPLPQGGQPYRLHQAPPPAYERRRIGRKVDLGVRAINTFLSCCLGQRLGIFAGSGVGKSVLLSMITRYSTFDIIIIGLVGERGREVQEFIEDDLGEEGLARSIMVVATSDESPLLRRQAALITLTIAEYFRDQGLKVLCMIDSVTRFAMAQREIGLAAGEMPATRGYTPTVFSELPKLLERAGPGTGEGTITGLFTVLVEGDDHNEPIADAVRGTLDGHIVMERAIADRGRFPAINILRSISRTMPQCNTGEEIKIIRRARTLLSTYEDMAEMIRLGAYRKGTDPEIDEAIDYQKPLNDFLAQDRNESADLESGYDQLANILGINLE